MIAAPIPAEEAARLDALYAFRVLDTDPELGYDDLTTIAASICGTPIALVSLIDAHRQWFKSHHGLDATETPRESAFCAHAILQSDTLVIEDASLDERFHDNPLHTGAPHVRFYAGTPLVTASGHALGTLCVIDHVPRSLSQAQLDSLVRLGRQVMTQLELRRARDEARAATQTKSDFLATMSHEIRTPLNGIVGMVQLLSDSALAPDQSEIVQVVQRSADHLLSVVNDVLEFSRLNDRQMNLEATPLNLRELTETVLAITADVARRRSIGLRLEIASDVVLDRVGDALRLRQVLLNFVANAIKFTPAGTVTLKVVNGIESPGLRLSVTDTGIGIAADVLPRLFERFAQADSSTTRRYGGTGLGLAIARELVQLMGGTIGATSMPGEGSCFWCELPLALSDEQSIDAFEATQNCGGGDRIHLAQNLAQNLAPAKRTPMLKGGYCDLGGRSVLIVEDDVTNITLLTRLLNIRNCMITVANNGVEALEHCQRGAFDVILMDGMMPTMDGYEAAKRIRQLPGNWSRQVPIIALTANSRSGDRERCMQAGMTDYVGKPITREALDAALNRAIAAS